MHKLIIALIVAGIITGGAVMAVSIPNASAFESDCQDGQDNDRDGYTDDNDSDCGEVPADTERGLCSDGIDNDLDELIDGADPDCETPVLVENDCSDGIDNDSDGKVDQADSDCPTTSQTVTFQETTVAARLFTSRTNGVLHIEVVQNGQVKGTTILSDNNLAVSVTSQPLSFPSPVTIMSNEPFQIQTYFIGSGRIIVSSITIQGIGAVVPVSVSAPSNETKNHNCADGLDNDLDGEVDHNDADCVDKPACGPWQHMSGGTCFDDTHNYNMTVTNLGLSFSQPDVFYDGGRWRLLIENPYYGDKSPPAPKTVDYLVRWVAPSGKIFEDDVGTFGAYGGTFDDTHSDREDEEALTGCASCELGRWTVHVYVSDDDLTYDQGMILHYSGYQFDEEGVRLQYLGAQTFTATLEQQSLIQQFCLAMPVC